MTRKTKIIATLGPATDSPDQIGKLLRAGVDVFRLNMSHAKHDWAREVTAHIREQCTPEDLDAAVLVDLQGPSIRTGDLEEKLTLEKGDTVEFRTKDAAPETKLSTTVNYPGLVNDVGEGDTLLVDNGELHFKVVKSLGDRLVCEALTGGSMGSRRHINLPGVRISMPPLTKKDLRDIDLAAEIKADFVAISFVRDAQHIEELRRILTEKESTARIVAKIEDQEAVRNIEPIIRAADAIMVARGDLGIEVHIQELPVIQRTILRECARIGRKVIVATHMLESMVENPTPTRAEVSDVANAIYEQADAVMLSGETSVGKYPVKAVETLATIAARMEQEPAIGFSKYIELTTEKQQTVKAAVVLANSLPESVIVTFTARGVLANYVAHQRPARSPIFAFTADATVARALHLNRGVTPVVTEFDSNHDTCIENALEDLRQAGHVEPGDPVVILSDILGSDFDTNAVLLRKA
jgi:pyruvate kinase